MSTSTSELGSERFPEEELVLQAWRRTQLRRLGVHGTLADRYGEDVDWHDVSALVDRGCPPDLAMAILV
jgi:hypothetical protein